MDQKFKKPKRPGMSVPAILVAMLGVILFFWSVGEGFDFVYCSDTAAASGFSFKWNPIDGCQIDVEARLSPLN